MTSWHCVKELAGLPGMLASESGIIRLAKREGWEVRNKTNGKGREYAITSLPKVTQQALQQRDRARHATLVNDRLLAMQAIEEQEREAAEEARQRKIEAAMAKLAAGRLSDRRQALFDAKLAIVRGFELYLAQHGKSKKETIKQFVELYNNDNLPPLASITTTIRKAKPKLSERTLERWQEKSKKDGIAGLIDNRDGHLLKDINVFTRQPELQSLCLHYVTTQPHITVANLHEVLEAEAVDLETGEILFELPSYWATHRYVSNWKKKHPELYLACTNPDAWKSQCMAAVGDASGDIERLNQRWEMDATPADWMLLDPESGQRKRYTCSVVIDLYSRRMLLLLSPTPKAQTHMKLLRLALIKWGVPEEIVTDNGKDYVANAFLQCVAALGIAHHQTAPFSPWQKPHVERGIKTILHSVLELLPNFLGHNVIERKAIDARKAFSERLFQKDHAVELDMHPDELQTLINEWLTGVYEQRWHGSLKATPFEMAADWTGQVKWITDERALDMLLAPLKGVRIVQKKGIQVDGNWYASPDLFRKVEVGTEVTLRESPDFGELIVYQEDKFICVAICPERTGVDRKELAAHTKAVQAERVKAEKKRLKMSVKVNPDRMVAGLTRQKAKEAGKLAIHPGRRIEYTSDGLEEAAKAADRLDNGPQQPALAPELQRALEERQAGGAQPQAPASNVTILVKTKEQNFREWLELNERMENGQPIEDQSDLNWWRDYQGTNEFRLMKRRNDAAMKEERSGAKVASFAPGINRP